MTTRPSRTVLRDQIIVTIAAAVWLVGTAAGFGLIGGESVQEQGGGLFSDSATLIAPHGPAFSIWSVVYLLIGGHIIWQWIARDSAIAAVSRLPAAASIALNGIWLLVVFQGWITVSVVVIILIVAALGLVLRATSGVAAEGWAPQVWVFVTFGLYLGWIAVATCANIALWLVDLGVPDTGTLATVLTLIVLVAVVGISRLIIAAADHAAFRAATAAAVTWGLAWAGVGRFVGETTSTVVGIAALVAAGIVLVLGVVGVRDARSNAA